MGRWLAYRLMKELGYVTVGYHQTNRKTYTGKTLKLWPVFVDHFKDTGCQTIKSPARRGTSFNLPDYAPGTTPETHAVWRFQSTDARYP